MKDIKFNTDTTMEFLGHWRPNGPWVLCAIVPDGPIETKTFDELGDEMRKWIDSHQNRQNLYFHVNSTRFALNKKAEKASIKSLDWLHIDIDPRAGEDLKKERERAYQLLREFNPAPTVIIDSGGGFQGFWKLEKPVVIDGDVSKAEELEAYNIQLEKLFGADACHNIDRIMRLPGTVNIPNKRKRDKGREESLAQVVAVNWELEYPLTKFTKAARVTTSNTGPIKVNISGNVRRLADTEELGDAVPERIKMIIVTGNDPDDPTKWPSRSECLFHVVCELVRAGVSDEMIASVLLDPDFGIAQSVLDAPRPERYAARQIERARELAINPHLSEMNRKHAVIESVGNKCLILSELMDYALNRRKIVLQNQANFCLRYKNDRIDIDMGDGKVKQVEAGTWWLGSTHRREFESICFVPGKEIENAYNLWRGFAVDAIPGDCDLFLNHVLHHICRKNEEHYEYLLNWMARAVQYPDTQGHTAIVMRGSHGVGKGFFAQEFGALWGNHFLQITDPKHLVGSFNAHLRDCSVLFGDEAFYAGDKKHESVLKALVTEQYLTIEAKGIDVEQARNYTHIILSSNNSWCVPAGATERRFFVLDVSDEKKENTKYFGRIEKQMKEQGGREAFLYMLQTRDISNFNVRVVPRTDALYEQKVLTQDGLEAWWFEKLVHGQILPGLDWEDEFLKHDLYEDYIDHLDIQKSRERRRSQTGLSHFLKKVLPSISSHQVINKREMKDGSFKEMREYAAHIPALGVCRAHYDQHFGGPHPWNNPDEYERILAKKDEGF